jgi:hypothetical protein
MGIYSAILTHLEIFYKFDEGDDFSEESNEETALSSGSKNRILQLNDKNKSQFCRTHKILDREGLSCYGWNNTALFFFQLLGLIIK